MTEHPDRLLAEYADGTLEVGDRAAVEDHLASCPACREELRQAARARALLRGLPEVEPPAGLTLAVRRRARRGGGRTAGVAWKVAVAAAAAGVIAVGAVTIATGPPDALTGGAEQQADAPAAGEVEAQRDATEGPAAPEAAEPGSSFRFTFTDRDHDPGSLATLGRRLRTEARASLEEGAVEQPATEFYAGFRIEEFPRPARDAAACIIRELPPRDLAVPFVIQAASFEGRPVYVAAFLQGPAPDQPYDRLLLWVVNRDDCGLRYFATLRL